MGNNGAKKSRVGPIEKIDQNPPVFSVKKRGFGGEFPPGELTRQKFSLVLVDVEFHSLCSTANLFGSYVGLLTLCVLRGFHFRVKTTKRRWLSPQNCSSFLAILGLIWHISVGLSPLWMISSSPCYMQRLSRFVCTPFHKNVARTNNSTQFLHRNQYENPLAQ